MSKPSSEAWKPEHIRSLLRVLPLVFLIGLGLFGGGVYFAALQTDLAMHGARTNGVVIDLVRGTTSTTPGRGDPAWFPVVAFETADRQSVRFRHRTGANPPDYRKGERVSVVYIPGSPENALIDEPVMNWVLPVLLLLVGAGLAVLSARGFVRLRRRAT